MAYTKPLDKKDVGYWWAEVNGKREIVYLDSNLLISMIGATGSKSFSYWMEQHDLEIRLLSFIER